MDTSILEGLGLSKGEIKVYLFLLELGSTKVGNIIEKSELASSAVHNSINSLVDKGLASYIKKGKIKYYQAAPPSQIVDFIETKKKNVLSILPQLELKQKLAIEKQEAEIFLDIKGIVTMLNLLIEDSKKGDKYMFFATYLDQNNEEIQKFFTKYDVKRKEKGLNVRGISPPSIRIYFKERKVLNMKYTSFPIPADISLCNNKVALISWGKKPMGILIKSKEINAMFKNYFEKVWKIC